jgi:hypothetical protein
MNEGHIYIDQCIAITNIMLIVIFKCRHQIYRNNQDINRDSRFVGNKILFIALIKLNKYIIYYIK